MDHPEARIQMYGSMATGLAIDSSDMDLLISGVFCFDAQRLLGFPMPPYVERQLMIEQLQNSIRICQITRMEKKKLFINTKSIFIVARSLKQLLSLSLKL